MKRIFAEIGFGNKNFLSTEFEEGKKEHRIRGFIRPRKIMDFYVRFCFLKTEIILSTKDILKIKKKDENRFKLLFGIGGKD